MSYDVNWRNKDSNDIYELYCEQPATPAAPPITPKRSTKSLDPAGRLPNRGAPQKPDNVDQETWDSLPIRDKHAVAEYKLAVMNKDEMQIGAAPMPPIGRALKFAKPAAKWIKNLFKKSPKNVPKPKPGVPKPHAPGTPRPGTPKPGKPRNWKDAARDIGLGTGVGAGLGGDDSDGDGIPDSQDPDAKAGAAGGGAAGGGGSGGGGDRDEADVKMKTATYQLQLPEIYAQQIYDQLGGQLGAGKGIEREVDDEQERAAGEGDQNTPEPSAQPAPTTSVPRLDNPSGAPQINKLKGHLPNPTQPSQRLS